MDGEKTLKEEKLLENKGERRGRKYCQYRGRDIRKDLQARLKWGFLNYVGLEELWKITGTPEESSF